MKAKQLFLQDGTETGVWFCEACRNVARSKDAAEECCSVRVCETCGKPVDRKYWVECDACLREAARAKEAERFEKAMKVSDTEYRGWVTDGDEGFWPDVGEYLESLDGEEPAAYLWACQPRRFVRVNTDNILEHICEDGFDDFDSNDLNGWTEFEAAIKAFEEANKDTVVYEADYALAVLVTREREEG